MNTDETLAWLRDESALRGLVMRYARACDRRDEAAFGALFLPDAVLEGPGFRFESARQIRKIPRQLERYSKTYHTLLGNQQFEVTADLARGEIYSMAHHLTPCGDAGYCDLIMYITYLDQYRRRTGEWRFARRCVVIEFTETRIVGDVSTIDAVMQGYRT